jgi:hypothetical protein
MPRALRLCGRLWPKGHYPDAAARLKNKNNAVTVDNGRGEMTLGSISGIIRSLMIEGLTDQPDSEPEIPLTQGQPAREWQPEGPATLWQAAVPSLSGRLAALSAVPRVSRVGLSGGESPRCVF